MTTYTTDELVPSSVISKNFGCYLSRVSNNEVEKIGVLRNNKLGAVIISSETYDFFQDLLEHIEIYNSIKDRINSNDFVEGKEMLSKFGLSL